MFGCLAGEMNSVPKGDRFIPSDCSQRRTFVFPQAKSKIRLGITARFFNDFQRSRALSAVGKFGDKHNSLRDNPRGFYSLTPRMA
jgi:hypothetical protein